MRVGKSILLLLLIVPLMTSCSGFWDPPSNSGGSTTTSNVFYVLNLTTQQIAAYTVGASSITAISGSPVNIGVTPIAMALSPNGNLLFVSTINGIYVYTVASNGALTLGNNGSAISSDPALALQVDSTNLWLIEASGVSATLNAIPINSSTGVPTSSQAQTTNLSATSINELAISPDNKNIFVALGRSGTDRVPFTAGNTNPLGTRINISPYNASTGAATSVAVDPKSHLVYIGETGTGSGTTNTGGLRVFTYSNFVEVSGSPYASGGGTPAAIHPKATGDYVYVANNFVSGSTNGNVSAWAVASVGSSYSLTALTTGATISAGQSPAGITEDPSGTYALVVNSNGSPDLNVYTFGSSGQLTSAYTASTGTDPVGAIAVTARTAQ